MKKASVDFACYLPSACEAAVWGAGARAGGRISNRAGEPYPPAGHPDDHAFSWEHGRVLGAWQIVWIEAGAGEFQGGRSAEVARVTAGDALFLPPGQWHRYRPSATSGWTELWVELEGALPGRLTEEGWLPAVPVLRRGESGEHGGRGAEVMGALHHALLAGDPVESMAQAVRLLALFRMPSIEPVQDVSRKVRQAERLMVERLAEGADMPALARELEMDYTRFRREFKKSTGLAPHQYLMRLRLEKAQRLLGATPATLDAIAEQAGFSSAFHLSAAFKDRFGVAPAHWRRGQV